MSLRPKFWVQTGSGEWLGFDDAAHPLLVEVTRDEVMWDLSLLGVDVDAATADRIGVAARVHGLSYPVVIEILAAMEKALERTLR